MLQPFYFDRLNDKYQEVIVEYLYCNIAVPDETKQFLSFNPGIEKIYILCEAKKLSYDTFEIVGRYTDKDNHIFEIKTIWNTEYHPPMYNSEKIPFLQYCMLKQNAILSYDEESNNLYCKYNELDTFRLFHDWKRIS